MVKIIRESSVPEEVEKLGEFLANLNTKKGKKFQIAEIQLFGDGEQDLNYQKFQHP